MQLDLWSILGYALVVLGQSLGIILLLVKRWRETRNVVGPIIAESKREPARFLSGLVISWGLTFSVLLLLTISAQAARSSSLLVNVLASGFGTMIMFGMLLLIFLIPNYIDTKKLKEENQSLRGAIQDLALKHQQLEEKVNKNSEQHVPLERKPAKKSTGLETLHESNSKSLRKEAKSKDNP